MTYGEGTLIVDFGKKNDSPDASSLFPNAFVTGYDTAIAVAAEAGKKDINEAIMNAGKVCQVSPAYHYEASAARFTVYSNEKLSESDFANKEIKVQRLVAVKEGGETIVKPGYTVSFTGKSAEVLAVSNHNANGVTTYVNTVTVSELEKGKTEYRDELAAAATVLG